MSQTEANPPQPVAAAAAAAAAAASSPTPFPPPTILTLSKCTLRNLHPADAPALQVACDSPAMAKYMSYRFKSPYTLEDAHNWVAFASTFKAPGSDVVPSLAICDPVTNVPVGGIGIKTKSDVEEFCFEIGYWTEEKVWGKGIMTEALRAYSKWVFENYPKANRLEGIVFEGNDGSAKVLERAGYVYEGTRRKAGTKNGWVFDISTYGLLREECNW